MFDMGFVSITDLRQSASSIIKGLKNTGDQVVFINNKPSAVLMSYEDYIELTSWPVSLVEFSYGELSTDEKHLVEEVKSLSESEFVNL